MTGKEKEKITFVCSVSCPQCKAVVNVLKKTRVITPAEPAEKEETFFAEKGVQLTLDQQNGENETSQQGETEQ